MAWLVTADPEIARYNYRQINVGRHVRVMLVDGTPLALEPREIRFDL